MPKFSIEQLIEAESAFKSTLDGDKANIDAMRTDADAKKAVLDGLTSAPERDIEAIKVASKDFKDIQKNIDIATENLSKAEEKFRRDQLTKIGCSPDNHPLTHTAVKHMTIKNEMNKSLDRVG